AAGLTNQVRAEWLYKTPVANSERWTYWTKTKVQPGDMIVSLRIPTLSMCLLSLVLLKEMDAGLWRQAQVIPSDEGGLGPVVAEFFPQRFGKRFIMTGK
ncbi:hypothetical protein X801_07319, partial [Opisthorchis viverrini]